MAERVTYADLVKKAAAKKAADKLPEPSPTSTNQPQPLPSTTNPSQTLPNTTNQASKDSSSIKTEPPKKLETSPSKNFTKVPNSLTTDAIPQGMFKGLSKHTYDVLYRLTRGAINPRREIQLTRMELMRLTGLSENTQRAHIKYLSLTGLVKISYETGKHEGATYEVFIPEEINSNPSQVVPSSANYYQPLPTSSDDSQKLGPDKYQHLVGLGTTNTIENTSSYDDAKTSLKTIVKSDDERTIDGLSILATKLDAAAKKITGKGISKSEAEKWGSLADLLILELEIAASRSSGVSSIPSFLTEVLRRQFFSARQPAVKSFSTVFSILLFGLVCLMSSCPS